MGTNMFFGNRSVLDSISDENVGLEIGTSGASGKGPQMYLNLNGESVLLSHDDAKDLCQAVSDIAHYLGYKIS